MATIIEPNQPDHSWRKRTAYFLASQTLSLFGSYVVQYAITWQITLTTKSGVWITLSILFGFLPTFFLAPFGGVWADRMDRKRLIILADGFIAVSTLALALLYESGLESPWLLLAALAIRAIGSAFHTPAVSAILPQIVPEEAIMRVNGIDATILSIVVLASPMAAATLLTKLPLGGILLVDVFTASVAIAILALFLKVPTNQNVAITEVGHQFQGLHSGLSYIRAHLFIRKLYVYLAIAYYFIGPVLLLTPLQIVRSYGEEFFLLTAIEVAFAVGMLLGGILVSSLGERIRNGAVSICVSLLFMAFCTVGVGFTPPFWLYCTLMGLLGLVTPFLTAPTTSLLQRKVEESYLGRIFGVMAMVSTSMTPLGMLVFGPLADFVTIESILVTSGIVLVALSFIMLRDQKFLAAGKPE